MTTQIKFKHDSASNWTSNNPVLSTGEIGVETDTGKMKVGDGVTAWSSLSYALSAGGTALTPSAVGTTVQAYDVTLDNMASAATTTGTMFIGDGTNFVEKTASEVRTALGTGAVALENGVTNSIWSGTLPVDAGGTNATNASTARTNLGLAIGSDVQAPGDYVESGDIGTSVQAYDSNLTSFVSTFTLPTADGSADQFLGTNGSATLGFAALAGGLTVYSTEDDLPLDSTASNADLAFVTGTDQFYTYYDGAWYYVATSELSGWVFQGSNYGYTSASSPSVGTFIDKFPFATDANAAGVGDLSTLRTSITGQSSASYGYNSGGYESPTASRSNIIDKFPFSTDTNATDVGDLTVARSGAAGQSSSTNGYSSGGLAAPGSVNTIDKFPVAADANATDVGDLTDIGYSGSGQSSTSYGYCVGLAGGPAAHKATIQKFSFSTDTNATTGADLSTTLYLIYGAGQSSTTHGYNSGGSPSAGGSHALIQKFSFSTDTDGTDVGDLTVARHSLSGGQSSTSYGYSTGGYTAPPSATGYSNVIDKFPFSTDANATDVGDLTASSTGGRVGQQY